MDPRAIGERVIRRRYECGLTQAELARAIGRWPSSIHRIESGQFTPAPATLQAIAQVLDTTAADLLGPDSEDAA